MNSFMPMRTRLWVDLWTRGHDFGWNRLWMDPWTRGPTLDGPDFGWALPAVIPCLQAWWTRGLDFGWTRGTFKDSERRDN